MSHMNDVMNQRLRESLGARQDGRVEKLQRVMGDRMALTPIEQAKRDAVEARRIADEEKAGK